MMAAHIVSAMSWMLLFPLTVPAAHRIATNHVSTQHRVARGCLVNAYVASSLLNGRTFRTLEHLNDVARWWLANVADVRLQGKTQERPLDRHAREQPHLVALPAQPYDTAVVVYRVVNVEGFVAYQQNFYSVPWRWLGQALPLRITEDEVIIYTPQLEALARHRLFPRSLTNQRSEDRTHRPRHDSGEPQLQLRERFAELGEGAVRFLDGLLRDQRCGKAQARKVLTFLATYARWDLVAALDRAVRFGAYSVGAVERILAARAKPKSVLEALAEEAPQETRRLRPDLFDEPVPPRPLSEYRQLLEKSDVPPNETHEDEPPAADDSAGPA